MRVVMFGSRGRRASLTVAVVLVVLFLAPSSHAAAPSVSFAQRFVPRAAAAFAPTAVQSPVFNAFAFASVWEVENGGSKGPVDGAKQAAYFRTVLNATTLPVLGNTPRGVNFCEVPIAPGANLFRGAYRWAAHADGSVCMDGASSSSASESFSACFRPNGTLELQDGPSVSLRIVPYGVAFEFTAVDEASQEKVVYREMLGRVTGTMYGVNVQGWGGWDSYFGDKSFGNSFLFQQVEEDWILFADAGPHSGRQYGLLISGINGFQGGYIATELDESSASLVSVRKTRLQLNKTCADAPQEVRLVATAENGASNAVVFDTYTTLSRFSGYSWTSAARWPGNEPNGPAAGTAWWEHRDAGPAASWRGVRGSQLMGGKGK